ncbi:MAG: hypothetical protein GY866_14405 [Proteobacteria bacterium]|nr:hypothetical protein [Pseudomonadota bacterium]
MARPLRISFPGAFYHVTSRGNERKTIYKSRRDREKFLEYLAEVHERYSAIIHAYCLMTNHYHLLLETPDANLPQIMKHINGSYSVYFNVKRKRSGHLFQGRYKAFLVYRDDYALELSRYIHLNPVRAAMVESADKYPWSSYRSYIGKSTVPVWLETSLIRHYIGSIQPQKDYERFVSDRNRLNDPSPLEKATAATILGPETFVESIKKRYLEGRSSDRDLPALRPLKSRPSFEQIASIVDGLVDNEKFARKLKIYLMKRFSGATLRAIGDSFGLGISAVSQICRRLETQAGDDRQTTKLLNEIEKRIMSNV